MLPMDIGLPRRQPDLVEDVSSPYAVWVKDSLEVAFDQVRRHSGQAVQRQKWLYDQRAVRRLFAIGNWVMRYYPAGKKCKLDYIWTGPYLIVPTLSWTVGIHRHPDEPVIFIHCQDVKKIPQPSGVQSWITIPPLGGAPAVPMLGASTVAHTSRDSPSVTALPPDEGVELADVDSVRNGRSVSRYRENIDDSVPNSVPVQDSQLIPPLILPVVVEEAVVGVCEAGLPSLTMLVVEDMNHDTPPSELVPMSTTTPESNLPPPPGFTPFVWLEDDGGLDVEDLCKRFSEDSSLTLSPISRGSSDIPNSPDVLEGGAWCPPLKDSSSEELPAVGYARLPLPSVDNSLMPELVWVPALPQPTGRIVDGEVPVPRWQLAQ